LNGSELAPAAELLRHEPAATATTDCLREASAQRLRDGRQEDGRRGGYHVAQGSDDGTDTTQESATGPGNRVEESHLLTLG